MANIVLTLTPIQAANLQHILEERGEELETNRGEGSAAEEVRDAIALNQLEMLLDDALKTAGP